MSTNMKPADELATVRAKIKSLQKREAQLKDGFKNGEYSEQGDFAFVSVSERNSKRFDRKAAEAELGDLSRFEVEISAVYITVHEVNDAA